jgi:hypothetical protein
MVERASLERTRRDGLTIDGSTLSRRRKESSYDNDSPFRSISLCPPAIAGMRAVQQIAIVITAIRREQNDYPVGKGSALLATSTAKSSGRGCFMTFSVP